MQAPGSVKKKRGRRTRHWSRSPLWPVMRTVVKQVAPLQPMEYTVEQGSTLQPVEETMVEKVDLYHRRMRPVDDPLQSRFWAGAVARGDEPTQEQVTVGDPGWSSVLLVDGPIAGAFLEELLPVGSPCRISLGRTASRERDPTLEQGQNVTVNEQQRQAAID